MELDKYFRILRFSIVYSMIQITKKVNISNNQIS